MTAPEGRKSRAAPLATTDWGEKMARKWLPVFLGLSLVLGMAVASMPPAGAGSSSTPPALTDLEGHWAKDRVQRVVEQGFMSGYPDLTFRPDRGMTRAEVATVLDNFLQKTEILGRVSLLHQELVALRTQVEALAAATYHSKGTFTFTNGTGGPVNDLHIEFNTPVNVVGRGPFKKVKGNNTSVVEVYDGDVAAGASVDIEVEGQAHEVYVKKWWWTRGSYDAAGKWTSQRVGDVHTGEPK